MGQKNFFAHKKRQENSLPTWGARKQLNIKSCCDRLQLYGKMENYFQEAIARE